MMTLELFPETNSLPMASSRRWPTPRASDVADGRIIDQHGRRTNRGGTLVFGANLADAVKSTLWPTPSLGMIRAENYTLKTSRRHYVDRSHQTHLTQWVRDPLMSSAVDSPVRTSALQARAQASPARVQDYGLNMPALLTRFDHASSSWRTSQLCLDGELESFSATWPRSGMTRNGIAYQLPPLVPLTDAIASGSLPTPVNYDATPGGPNNHYKGLGHTARHRPHLWPTPMSDDALHRQRDLCKRIASKKQLGLLDHVRLKAEQLWPTPSAMNSPDQAGLHSFNGMYWRKPDGRKHQTDLALAVKGRQQWPSPTVADSKNLGAPSQMERNTLPLNAAVKQWPTPKADQVSFNRRKPTPGQAAGKAGWDLSTRVLEAQRFPTPKAEDAECAGGHRGVSDTHYSQTVTDSGAMPGSLNPTWVEWLMGFPLSWTALAEYPSNARLSYERIPKAEKVEPPPAASTD